ncbi:MAG: DUF4443 domain-containing protein [Candidatus Baldrarchaeota archaeon]
MKKIEEIFSKIFKEPEQKVGPPPAYKPHHILLTLFILHKSGKPVGRYVLMDRLGIGEASARTLLKFLTNLGLIKSVDRKGHVLTGLGEKVVTKIMEKIVDIKEVKGLKNVTLGPVNVACHIKNTAHLIKDGLKQRDAAIMAGAKGATTLIVRSGKITFPREDVKIGEENEKVLNRLFDLKEGDVIVIGTGDSLKEAENGAVAATLTILSLPNLK